LNEDLFAFMQY